MADQMRAFCEKLVAKFQAKDLMSVEAFVKLHRNLIPIRAAAATRSSGDRNDVRTVSVVGGSVAGTAAARRRASSSTSIFGNVALHDEAAATLASLAQQSSGFTGAMESGEAEARFQDYMDDFSAVHWNMVKYQEQIVHHDSENHSQFVVDLVAAVLEPLQSINADESTIDSVSSAIKQLAATVSNSTGSSSGETTLYTTFSISRTSDDDPVFYGVFFTVLQMDHQATKKSDVITSDADTYTFLFQLNSALLVQYAALYDTLTQSSILDWIASHTI